MVREGTATGVVMGETRRALLVGNGTYTDPNIPPLAAPAFDVASFERVLSDPHVGGYAVDVLLDRPLAEVRRAVELFYSKATSDDVLLLYFSGHGVSVDGAGLYFPVADTQTDLFQSTSLDASFINNQIRQSACRKNVVLLDCCHAGAFSEGPRRASLSHEFAGDGRAVLSAARSEQLAWESGPGPGGQPGSFFTLTVVEGLATGAADPHGSGSVTVDDLYEYVRDRVVEQSAGQQVPVKIENITERLVVADNHKDRPAPARGGPVPSLPELMLLLLSEEPSTVAGALVETGVDPGVAEAVTANVLDRLRHGYGVADRKHYAGSAPIDAIYALVGEGFPIEVANALVQHLWSSGEEPPSPPPVTGEARVPPLGTVALQTSERGVILGPQAYEWSDVDGFAYWATSSSFNGIRTDTSWFIVLSTRVAGNVDIQLKEGTLAGRARLDRDNALWRGMQNVLQHHVGRRLLSEFIDALERGQPVTIGRLTAKPSGLMVTGAFGKPKYLTWDAFAGTVVHPDRVVIMSRRPNGKASVWGSVNRKVINAMMVPDFLLVAARCMAPSTTR
jgi:hypothetical protein